MVFRDLAHAARVLRKAPLFTIACVLTIGLGIGVSTAIFGVTNAVLLRPLPYRDPGRLVFAMMNMDRRGVKDFLFSTTDVVDLRAGSRAVFEETGAVQTGRQAVPKQDGSLEEVRYASVTPGFFHMMGARIALGRDFVEADGEPPATAAPLATPASTVILSWDYFQRRFGGDPGILGRNPPGTRPGTAQIVGVLAPGFELLFPPETNMERLPDMWFAARLPYDNSNRNAVSLRVIARLKEGVTLERAQSAVETVAAELRKKSIIWQSSGFDIRLEYMRRHLVERVRPALLALTGAVIFLLLIACANVANLLFVRAWLRERELAVRTALGGSRWRLIRQMLAEALLLAFSGALLGLALAWAGIRELRAIAPANLPRLDSISIDPAVVGFAALAALGAAALFGLAPAWRGARPDVARVLRATGRTAGLGTSGLPRSIVVVVEVALSFVLLIGSGLMVRSFMALQHVAKGYDPGGLLTFQLLGSRGGDQPPQRAAFMREIQAALQALPGVQGVTASVPFPLAGTFYSTRWGREEALGDPSRFHSADQLVVLPGYFDTLRTPLLAGRTFTEADNSPDRYVVIIDDLLAAKAFPGESAVGKRILIRANIPAEVIGVVAHERGVSLAEPGREQFYITDGFVGHGVVSIWAIRTAGDPARYAGAVRAAIGKFGSRLAITQIEPMDSLVWRAQAGTRFQLLLIGVFAAIAALLAAVGLYGVLSTVVQQRTAEIGVRMALGAAPGSIFRLVVGHGLRLTAAGIAIGLAAAFELTRVMTGMLVEVKPTDPATFAVMAGLFLWIAAMAAWLPARRAAGLDPAMALRRE